MALINNDLITVQRELAKTNAKLKAANEMKNRVIGILAHDLRNPLNAIIGFTGLLEQILAGRTSDKEMSFLTAIHDAGRDMLTLVEDTLSMSALESGQMVLSCKPFDFADLAARTVRMLTVMAERKGVSLVFERPPTAVPIRADPTKISQVLNNLIINAIKFSHVGGEVRVTVSGETGEAACLTVTDHGTGIPAEMQARLYEPFVEGHRRGTAGESTTGLGLFICKSIVVAHGGTIAVTSQADWGSSFVVTLPAEC
jgi:signal transduction histidine kinase